MALTTEPGPLPETRRILTAAVNDVLAELGEPLIPTADPAVGRTDTRTCPHCWQVGVTGRPCAGCGYPL